MSRATYRPQGEELRALESYAAEYGRYWKRALALDWYQARTRGVPDFPNRGALLHALRNHPDFGPRGLELFRFSNV